MSKESREALQSKAKAMRDQQRKQDSRMTFARRSISALGALVLIGALVIGFFFVNNVSKQAREEGANNSQGEQLVPSTVDADGAFVVKSDKASATSIRVDNFFDPMCPGCGIVDRAIGTDMANKVDSGEIELHLRPVSFLDRASSDQYSTRAVNAFITISEHDPRKALDFMSRIYQSDFQPEEAGSYVSVPDDSFVKVAEEVGVPYDEAAKIKEHHYFDWIESNSNAQMNDKELFPNGFSTPSIFVGLTYENGKKTSGNKIDFTSGEGLTTIFDNALKDVQKN